MTPLLARLRRRTSPVYADPVFDMQAISDDWFRSHFVYAAGVVGDWLGGVMPLEGSRLLDFGCGDGITDLGVRLRFKPDLVTGVDVRPDHDALARAAQKAMGLARLPAGLEFRTIGAGERLADGPPVDAIYSWSTFEHIDRPLLPAVAADLYGLLKPGGWFFLQIDPLYFSPQGSHLGRFVAEPWAHLTLDGNALWQRVRQHTGEIAGTDRDLSFDSHGAEAYKRFIFDEFLALNRLTADELEAVLKQAGFRVERQERRQVPDPIPPELLSRYDEATLRTTEVMLLLRKPG